MITGFINLLRKLTRLFSFRDKKDTTATVPQDPRLSFQEEERPELRRRNSFGPIIDLNTSEYSDFYQPTHAEEEAYRALFAPRLPLPGNLFVAPAPPAHVIIPHHAAKQLGGRSRTFGRSRSLDLPPPDWRTYDEFFEAKYGPPPPPKEKEKDE